MAVDKIQSEKWEATEIPNILAVIAGSGQYPFEIVRSARKAGVGRIVLAAFKENTARGLEVEVDETVWLRVGQLGGLLSFLKRTGATHGIMAGQIHPGHLFNLFPDIRGLMLLGRLRRRNATTIFSSIAEEMELAGCTLLPAYRFIEDHLAPTGLVAGPRPTRRQMEDICYAFEIAKTVSNLEIGQTVVVRNGSILAVEGREGTDATLVRGGILGNRKCVAAKVAKRNHDPRFDLPVIGPVTIEVASDAGIRILAIEAGMTLIVEPERTRALAQHSRVCVFGLDAVTVAELTHPNERHHRAGEPSRFI